MQLPAGKLDIAGQSESSEILKWKIFWKKKIKLKKMKIKIFNFLSKIARACKI